MGGGGGGGLLSRVSAARFFLILGKVIKGIHASLSAFGTNSVMKMKSTSLKIHELLPKSN